MERLYKYKGLMYVISLIIGIFIMILAFYLSFSSISFEISQSIYYSEYDKDHITQLLISELPIILMVGTILFLPLFYSLYVLEQKHTKFQHKKHMESIKSLIEQTPLPDDKWYDELMELQVWMDRYQKDQQRLHSYLSHEQKNIIMLLQAQCSEYQDVKLHQTIEKLKHSIDDVLTLFVDHTQEQEELDLAMICAQMCDNYRKLGLDISFHFDETCDYLITGRTYWLERAIANILDNAIKYGNHNPVELQLTKKQQTISCKIMDHGIGMAQDQLDHIFDYCYRIQNLQKNGEGIGLSLVAHVMKLCHGTVFVESAVGIGSCFHLCFPDAEVSK